MDKIFQINWESVFVPTVSLLEIVLRGTVVYLMIFVLLRLLRRESGSLGIADVLFLVIIADAAQNAMSSEYRSITEGLLLVLTIAFWDFTLDWLTYRYPRFSRLIQPPPLLLVSNGIMMRKNMRQEMITEDELKSQLRQQGVEDLSQVKKCYFEAGGQISVIRLGA